MGHKHLHELLKEDQEPFHLKTFIADRRSRLKSATTTTTTVAGKSEIVVRKRKPIIKSPSSSTTTRNFCINHVCFFSPEDSPAFNKSPFLDFPTRDSKSPCNNAAVFLHIPARTAAVLLDAATRVQKPKPGSKQLKFGLFGSFLRRLKDRNTRTKTREIEPVNVNVTPSSPATGRSRKKSVDGGDDGCRRSCGGWSEKSPEMETSCTSRSIHEFEKIDCLWSNPSSPFRFSLTRSPSPTRRKTDPSSPAASPYRHFRQDKESYEVGCAEEINRQDDDEKEQCSPVSVLDPLFDDDEEEGDGGAIEEDCYDIECSYANVQRAKHQLLQKLKRFERLAGLDPVDLENRMLEQCSNEDEDVLESEEEWTNEECFREIVNHLGVGKIPWYMKKLVFDLIEEENKNKNKNEEHEMIVQRVCKRLHLWKVVDLNTIDMIVETDFISERWKWCDKETIRDIGKDIEMGIFGFLVDELAHELVF